MLPTYCPAAGPWVPGEIRDCTLADQAAAGLRSGPSPGPGLRGAGAVTQLEGARQPSARGLGPAAEGAPGAQETPGSLAGDQPQPRCLGLSG